MREGGLGLRQISDWALFLANGLSPESAARLQKILPEVGLARFAAAVSTAAVRHLGLPLGKNPFPPADAALADALFADFMASGNFGRGNAAYEGSAIVTLHREGKKGLATALDNVREKCRAEWPITKKHPILLLYYVPFWVIRRMLKAPVHPLLMLKSADARGKLYDTLVLFQTQTKEVDK